MPHSEIPFPSTILTAASLEVALRKAGQATAAALEVKEGSRSIEGVLEPLEALAEALADCLQVTSHLTVTLSTWRERAPDGAALREALGVEVTALSLYGESLDREATERSGEARAFLQGKGAAYHQVVQELNQLLDES